jgi:N-acetylneuraminic acid mutarotase
MATARNGVDAVAIDGIAYVIGGQGCSDTTGSDCYALDTVEAFSPARNAWRTMAPMPAPRMDVGATLGRDGRIYVAGGRVLATWSTRSMHIRRVPTPGGH